MGSVTPTRLLLFVWALPGLAMLRGIFLDPASPYAVSKLTATICFVGIVVTVLGATSARMVQLSEPGTRPAPSPRVVRVVVTVVAALGTIGAFFAIRAWKNLGIDVFSPDSFIFYSMNVLYAESGLLSGPEGRVYALLPVLLFLTVYLWRHNLLSRNVAIALTAAAIVLMISPRRSTLITSAIASVIIWLQGRKISTTRLIVGGCVAAVTFLLFFGLTQSSLGKLETSGLASTLQSVLYYYSSSPIVMDALVRTHHFADTWIIGNSVARMSNALFDTRLAVDLSVPFVSTPEPANTVPAFYYFYKSGGFITLVLASFSAGFLSALSLRLYILRRSFVFATFSALCMTAMILSIRECVFISYDFLYWVLVVAALSWVLNLRFTTR